MHAHNVAPPRRPRRPQGARAALPARGPAGGGAPADRGRVLPEGARAAGRQRRDAHQRAASRSPPIPRAHYELSLARALGRRRPAAPRDRRRDRSAARGDARTRPTTWCACCRRVNGVATVELVAVNAAMAGVEPAAFPLVLAALEAISEPEWNAFGLTTTTSSVFPMLHRERTVPRRARHRLPRELHGRRRRPRLDDDRARGRAVPAQHRRPARRGDDRSRCSGSRRALRLLHRRVGGAVAVAVARRTPRLHRRRRRRDRARRQGHVPASPTSTTTTRATCST